MKILYKYPTRQRFLWFKQTLETYYSMMSGKYPFEFRVTLDSDDIEMNSQDAVDFMDGYRNLTYGYGEHKSKIDAINADMDGLEWDILVLVSDDMVPIVQDFDEVIIKAMMQNFPDTDGALHFNDGLFGEDRCITLSIMGRKIYERFGYIYHPSYKSFYCDNEFTDEVYQLKKVVYIPQIIIKHLWTGGPQSDDELYRRNSKMGAPDEMTYKRRKLAGFPK